MQSIIHVGVLCKWDNTMDQNDNEGVRHSVKEIPFGLRTVQSLSNCVGPLRTVLTPK